MKGQLFFFPVILLIGLCCQDNGNNDPTDLPEVAFKTMTIAEGDGGITALSFPITLSKESNQTISFDLSTQDGSAKAGSDFEVVNSQSVSFAPGETSKTFQVNILTDEDLELTEQFVINVSNVQNAKASTLEFGGIITDDDTYQPEAVADGFITPATYPSMDLVWADEFDQTSLNTNDWNYEIGNGCDRNYVAGGIMSWRNILILKKMSL